MSYSEEFMRTAEWSPQGRCVDICEKENYIVVLRIKIKWKV
jgi:hypothetical protein